MAVESPWPIDPTPDDMAYVGVCARCHGIAFVCSTDIMPTHFPMLRKSLKRGDSLHRLPIERAKNPAWHFCRCVPQNKETLPW